ncbi:MAG: GAF and ANTAR domain-containing protein [Jatrophihabitantaceae bacterium]
MTASGVHGEPPTALTLAQGFADLARDIAGKSSEDDTWAAIVQAAVDTIEGAEAADITILRANKFRSIAPTSQLACDVDAIQYELRSGPCVDAVLEETRFRTGDLENDPRWPEFGKRAALEYGVYSMLAFRLYLEADDTIGGLNLYATRRDAFPDSAVIHGEVFATHAAIVLAGARSRDQAANLQQALESNRDIGVALGILMSRHLTTREQAFDLLRMASQHTHRKLREVANEVTETGMLDFPPALRSASAEQV